MHLNIQSLASELVLVPVPAQEPGLAQEQEPLPQEPPPARSSS